MELNCNTVLIEILIIATPADKVLFKWVYHLSNREPKIVKYSYVLEYQFNPMLSFRSAAMQAACVKKNLYFNLSLSRVRREKLFRVFRLPKGKTHFLNGSFWWPAFGEFPRPLWVQLNHQCKRWAILSENNWCFDEKSKAKACVDQKGDKSNQPHPPLDKTSR